LSERSGFAPTEPVKVIEVVIQPFSSEQFAKYSWERVAPNPQVFASLIEPPPVVTPDGPEKVVLKWTRGAANFTELSGRIGRAIVGIMAISLDPADCTDRLRILSRQVQQMIDAAPTDWTAKVPRLPWQLSVGLAIGVAIVILSLALDAFVGGIAGKIALILGVSWILLGFFIPKFRRPSRLREAWRRGLIDGDQDGTVRAALATIGIQLPTDEHVSPLGDSTATAG